jgi:predicted DNA-binding WGR domain protein
MDSGRRITGRSGTNRPPQGAKHPPMAVEQLATFRHELHLVSLNPAKNRYRFCTLAWQTSLFGELALVRTWGRLGKVGRSQAHFYPDVMSAQPAIIALLRRRLRHGYRAVSWD